MRQVNGFMNAKKERGSASSLTSSAYFHKECSELLDNIEQELSENEKKKKQKILEEQIALFL